MKHFTGRILVPFLSLVLWLAAAELGVRALALAPDIVPIEIDMPYGPFVSVADPRLVYQPKPGFGDFNAYGIRDRERALAKPSGIYRIVVLGDSVAFGLCSVSQGTLALADVFPARLERALEEWRGGFEVINLGVSGYNTTQEILFFEEKGLPLSPDLVLVAYVMNDHVDRAAELQRFARHPDFADSQSLRRALRKNALLHSALVRAVWYRAGGAEEDTELAPEQAGDYRAIVAEDLEPLRGLAREHGFDVLVVLFPRMTQQKDGVYLPAHRHEIVAEVARDLGFQALDLTAGFLSAGDGDLRRLLGRCTSMHPDEFGHRVAARLIFEYLRDDRRLLD